MFQKIKTHLLQNIIFWLVVLASILVYAQSLHFPAISWDDPEMVFKNKDVQHFNLINLFSNHYVGNYIPLTMLTHALTWLVFKNNAFGYHLLNLLLHLYNGYLVYKLTTLLFKQKNIANITVVIFLLHPLQTESVNWIAELKNIGYVTFFIAGLTQYFYYVTNKTKKHIWYTFLFFIAACLYKPSAVVFPLALICIDIFVHQRFDKKFILNKIPYLAISILFGLINLKTQAADQFINYAHNFPLHERIFNAGLALFNYCKLFILPYNLSIIYPFPQNTTINSVIGSAFIVIFCIALYASYKKNNTLIFGAIMFTIINLILVLQFIPFGEVLNADRYMYLPILGFAWLIGIGITKFLKNTFIVPVSLILILSPITYLRSNQWQSSIVLYEDIIKKYPNNFLALNSLGVENMMRNNDDKAYQYFNHAINISPLNYKGLYNRALLNLKNNQPKIAITDLNNVLKIYDYEKAYVARASANYALMNYTNAREDANTALFKNKNNHKAYFVLANCYNDENKLDNAIDFYNRAIKLNNEEPDYYFKRAIAFGKKQQFANCLNDLNTCLNLNQNYAEAYYWRGVAKVNLKQNPCDDFKRASENNNAAAKEAYIKFCN